MSDTPISLDQLRKLAERTFEELYAVQQNIPSAFTLTNSVDSTSTDTAATPASVKATYDLATNVYSQVNDVYDEVNNAHVVAEAAATAANMGWTAVNATTDTWGITMLVNDVTNTSTNHAATPASVYAAYNVANSAYKEANSASKNAQKACTVSANANTLAAAADDNAVNASDWADLAFNQANAAYDAANSATTAATMAVDTVGNGWIPVNATTSARGITILVNSVADTSTNCATTPASVKAAYDSANTANAAANIANTSAASAYTRANAAYNQANNAMASLGWIAVNATTSTRGITMLVNSISNTSTEYAATPASVCAAYDAAGAAYNTANSANTMAINAYARANAAYDEANNAAAVVGWVAVNASTSVRGITILVNSVSDTSTDSAATPASVNAVYDRASSAYDQANNAYDQANAAYNWANAAYDAANTVLDTALAAANIAAANATKNVVASMCGPTYINGEGTAYSNNAYSFAAGYDANAYNVSAIAIGSTAKSNCNFASAIGVNARMYTSNGMSFGYNTLATSNSISLGYGTISGSNGIGIGCNTYCFYGSATNFTTLSYSIIIGAYASANSSGTIAIGTNVRVNGYALSTVEGSSTKQTVYINGTKSIAIGSNAHLRGSYQTVLGSNACGNCASSTVIGTNGCAKYLWSTALGYSAVTTKANSIQLGNNTSLSSITSKVTITTTSDERDKTDVEPVPDGATEFLKKVKAVTFVYNQRAAYNLTDPEKDSDGNPIIEDGVDYLTDKDHENIDKYGFCRYDKIAHAAGTKKGSRRRAGLLAQETQAALKEVYGDESFANLVDDNLYDYDDVPDDVESTLAMNYNGFIPFLIKAIQELSARIAELEGNNTS